VVLNYNGANDTKKCVLSLQDSGYTNLDIVLVDNASPDGSGDILAEAFPDLPLLRQQSNIGYAGGNNAGIRYALGKNANFILIINNDVIVEPGFLQPMVDLLNRDAGIGIVNAKVFYQSAPDHVFSAAGEFSRLLCTGLNKSWNNEICKSSTLECEVDYICGVLFLARREVFETVGLFDERFFMYFEDMEFSHRARTRYRLAYTARSVAFHKSGGGKGWKSYSDLYLYHHTRNRLWAFEDEPVLYRIYVVLFAFMNSLAKATVLSLNLIDSPRNTLRQWQALYKGFVDGIRGREA
jgi:GT2 family glycosyltransferase